MAFHRRVAISATLIISFSLGLYLMRLSQGRVAFHDVCDLVQEKFFLDGEMLQNWVRSCHLRASKVSLLSSHEELVKQIQDQMSQMPVSHFLIYAPQENDRIWKGQTSETGARARWMDNHAIIYQILPGTPATKVGLRLGDEVLTINGEKIADPDAVSSRAGRYTILRDGKTRELVLPTAPFLVDSHPSLHQLDDETALIEISSFRGEFFSDGFWKGFVGRWKPYHRLIIDLRENLGGNFVGMLRTLSPLFCQPTEIGRLLQPRKKNGEPTDLVNNLDDDTQIAEMDREGVVRLRTFAGYGCFRGPVAVLIGPHTASVSEIFSAAISKRPRTLVMGQPSAGDVVMAIWYDLPELGPGYSISIPQAQFKTVTGEILEGQGVFPQREIFDRLGVWRTGRDAWIDAALRTRF